MRSSFFLSAICAAGALGSPVDKRVYETDLTIVTVTTWLTSPPTQPTTAAPVEQYKSIPTTTSSVVEQTVAPVPEPPAPVVESSSSVASMVQSTSAAPVVEPTAAPLAMIELPTLFSSAATSTFSTEYSASSATTFSTSTSASAAPSSPAGNSYQSTVLYNHNIHRSNHSANSLTWSSSLEASAQILASRCVYEHDTSINGGGYGQNIGYGVAADNVGQMITNLMYNDEFGFFENLFGQPDPDMTLFDKWGHFTQILWKGTTEVACATVTCPSLGNVDSSQPVPFTVCNYSPAGNYDGEYADNVGHPLGNAFFSA